MRLSTLTLRRLDIEGGKQRTREMAKVNPYARIMNSRMKIGYGACKKGNDDLKSEMIESLSAKASPIFLDHIYPINCKISY